MQWFPWEHGMTNLANLVDLSCKTLFIFQFLNYGRERSTQVNMQSCSQEKQAS